jgi:hypothetical protein
LYLFNNKVTDVVHALWGVAALKTQGGLRTGPVSSTEIYNLSDQGDTDQGAINEHLKGIFSSMSRIPYLLD